MQTDVDAEKMRDRLVRILYWAVFLAAAVLLCRFVLPRIAPFIVALLMALAAKPAVRFLREKVRIGRTAAGILPVILLYLLLAFLIGFLGVRLFDYLKDLATGLPGFYRNSFLPAATRLFDGLRHLTERFDPDSADTLGSIIDMASAQLENTVVSFAGKLLGRLTTAAFGLPAVFLGALIAVIATVFLAVDWDRIRAFCRHQLSDGQREMADRVLENLSGTIRKYVRSYALILCITFCELLIGFLILGIGNPAGVALAIAVFDVLPVVGCGTVLIPWSVVSFLTGNWPLGAGLFFHYVVIAIVRNVIEPKIVGTRVGLHPLVTLLGMVLGRALFGPVGILGLPFAMAIVAALNEQGAIHLYKRMPEREAAGSVREGSAGSGNDASEASTEAFERSAQAQDTDTAEARKKEEKKEGDEA